MTIGPAYGRDYKSKEAVLADWNNNKDFVVYGIDGGTYTNKADLEKILPKGAPVNIRYSKLRKVLVIKI